MDALADWPEDVQRRHQQTLTNIKAGAIVDTLSPIPAEVESKTLSDTLTELKA